MSFCSSPDAWFQNRLNSITYLQTAKNSCWPFTKLTQDEFIRLTTPLSTIPIVYDLDQVSDMTLMPIGIVGSACSMVAVWRKAVKKKDHFYIWMLLVGIMDLLVNTLHFPATLSKGRLFKNVYESSYVGTELMCIFYGLTAGFSLAADMCTLALTIERFLGICKPTSFQGEKKRKYRLVIYIVVVVISMIRLVRYSIEFQAAESSQTVDSVQKLYIWQSNPITETKFFEILIDISDLVLPFILLIAMLYFSTRIAIVMVKRKNQVKNIGASTTGNRGTGPLFAQTAVTRTTSMPAVDEPISQLQVTALQSVPQAQKPAPQPPQAGASERTKSMLQLLVILVSLFMLNQIGYCLYATAYILMTCMKAITFESAATEVSAYVTAVVYKEYITLFSIVAECFSRSTCFFFYYAFSISIRDEFKRAIRCR